MPGCCARPGACGARLWGRAAAGCGRCGTGGRTGAPGCGLPAAGCGRGALGRGAGPLRGAETVRPVGTVGTARRTGCAGVTRSRVCCGNRGVGGGCGAPGAEGFGGSGAGGRAWRGAAGRWVAVGGTPGDGVVWRASGVAATGGAEGGAEPVEVRVGTAAPGVEAVGRARWACSAGAWPEAGGGEDGASAEGLATGGRNGPPLLSGGRKGAGRNDAPEADFGRRGIVGTADEVGFGRSMAFAGRCRSRVGSSNSGKGLESDFDSPPRRSLICSMVAGSTELE